MPANTMKPKQDKPQPNPEPVQPPAPSPTPGTVKVLYHNELVGMGPVQVSVDSQVEQREGKDKKQYQVVLLTIRKRPGDGHEPEQRLYVCENAECGSFFDGQFGTVFTLVAEASKMDGGSMVPAGLVYVGEPGTSVPPPQPAKLENEQDEFECPQCGISRISRDKCQNPACASNAVGKPVSPQQLSPAGTPVAAKAPDLADQVLNPPEHAGKPETPQGPPKVKCTQVRYDRAVGLPEYGSVKVGVSLELEGDTKMAAALWMAKRACDAWIDAAYPGQRMGL